MLALDLHQDGVHVHVAVVVRLQQQIEVGVSHRPAGGADIYCSLLQGFCLALLPHREWGGGRGDLEEDNGVVGGQRTSCRSGAA